MGSIPDEGWPRASEAKKVWQRRDLGRLHELYAKPIEARARKIALDFRLPWALSELRECGRNSLYELGKQSGYWEQLGIPLSEAAPNFIAKAIGKCGKSIQAREQSEGRKRQPPSPECVRDALEAFSKKQWALFIPGFDREDLTPLRTQLDEHTNELKQRLGAAKFNGLYGAAVLRGMALFFEHPEKIEVLHIWAPLRAWRLWQESRARNCRGLSSSDKRRTTAELGSARHIVSQLALEAKTAGLKLYGKKVTKWRDSFEQESFDDFDGNLTDYVLKKCYPEVYERLQRSQKTKE